MLGSSWVPMVDAMVEGPAPSATNGWPQKGNPLMATSTVARLSGGCGQSVPPGCGEQAAVLFCATERVVEFYIYIYIYSSTRGARSLWFARKFVLIPHGPLFLSRQYNNTKKALRRKHVRGPPAYDGCPKKGHLKKGLGPSF